MQAHQRPSKSKAIAACAAVAAAGLLSGCATGPNRNPADPLEPLNRYTFTFNDAIDRAVAKPLAKGYNKVVPRPARTAVENFFSNLGDVVTMVNDFLQLKFEDGMTDLTRVAFNSTFGIAGLIDIATPAGLPKHDQDFGLTLGHYGLPSGPFLVLPLFGPSSFRDAVGFGVDQSFFAPANYTRPAVRNSLWFSNFVSTRARYLNATNLLEEAALDKYLFVRDAYLGQRRSRLSEGQEEELPNYEKEGTPAPVPSQGPPPTPTPSPGQLPAPGQAR
jgi:phospholipid-binding lipoprotein MlaA